MICKKCHSSNVVVNMSSYTKSKSRSLIWNLLMILLTGGLWLVWMLIRKSKETVIHEKTCVCQTCGDSWNIK